MFELKVRKPEQSKRLPVDVLVDGKVVGDVKPHGDSRWHAAITLGKSLTSLLIQGFGETPDEAVFNAVEDGKARLARESDQLAAFEAAINRQSAQVA